jgi:hypothetical protein
MHSEHATKRLLRVAFAILNIKWICAERLWTKSAESEDPALGHWERSTGHEGTALLWNCRNCSTVISGRLCKITGPKLSVLPTLTRFAVLSVFLVETRSLLGARAPIQAQAIFSTFGLAR